MCGIVGILSNGNLSVQERRAFAWMHYFDKTRGLDSAGIFWGDEKNARAFKGVGSPEDVWNNKAAGKVLSYSGELLDPRVLFAVGHNRAATSGEITSANAHPFRHGHIIGVHNGSVPQYNLTAMEKDLKDGKGEPVDSSTILKLLSEGKTIADLEANYSFAYALVWHNQRDQTVNIARNEERPLYICYNASKSTVLWASEGWMIQQALRAARIAGGYNTIEVVPPFTHIKFDLSRASIVGSVEATPYPKRVVAVANNWRGGRGNAFEDESEWDFYGISRGVETTTVPHVNAGSKPNLALGIGASPWHHHPVGAITKDNFDTFTGGRCAFCSNPVTFGEFEQDLLRFLGPTDCICHECVVASEVRVA